MSQTGSNMFTHSSPEIFLGQVEQVALNFDDLHMYEELELMGFMQNITREQQFSFRMSVFRSNIIITVEKVKHLHPGCVSDTRVHYIL